MDFEDSPEIPKSGMYKIVYSAEYGQFGGKPYGLLVANYDFGPGPQDITLLQNCAAVATMSHAPFIAAAASGFFGLDDYLTLPLAGKGPADDMEIKVRVDKILVSGSEATEGTVGTDTFYYKWSMDNGRTGLAANNVLVNAGTNPIWQLPDNNGSIAIGTVCDAGRILIDMVNASTLKLNDEFTFRTSAPAFDTTKLAAALVPLKDTQTDWGQLYVCGALDAAMISQLDTFINSMATAASGAKSFRWFSGSIRIPDVAESDATYQTYAGTVRATSSSVWGSVGAGANKVTSAISGRRYHRDPMFQVAPQVQALSPELSIANLTVGILPGCTLFDAEGNPEDHDEALMPGLDDLGFLTLRTWRGRTGIYVNQDKIFCPDGSDFILIPLRRVFNLFCEVIENALITRLMKPIFVSVQTGLILESNAQQIEASVRAQVRAHIMNKPMASGYSFTLSRADNILSTRTLTAEAQLISLGYPNKFTVSIGFSNPANNIQTT